ncbi:hypothetical protein ETC03_19990, partial [Geobacillus sp. MMMUD3]|nr:hypothetical protein [Geobacillus sp. MMMUD3]
ASIVLPSPGFDPAASLTAVAEEKATSLYGVPTMFIAANGRTRPARSEACRLRVSSTVIVGSLPRVAVELSACPQSQPTCGFRIVHMLAVVCRRGLG